MGFNPEYINLLKQFEGYFAQPYVCPAGKCTIGYGTNLEAHRAFIPSPELRKATHITGKRLVNELIKTGMYWSREKAEQAMLTELEQVDTALRSRCEAYNKLLALGETERACALLDMAYNMGVAGLMGFKNTLRYVAAGDYQKAAANMRQSLWFRQVGRRSRAICSVMETGKFPEKLD